MPTGAPKVTPPLSASPLPVPQSRRRSRRQALTRKLEWLSAIVSQWTRSGSAFGWALFIIVVWAVIGPFVGYSTTWLLLINTSTTIVTFLMVFLVQRAQNKDALAIQLKLDELVAAMHGASNRLIDIESMNEEDLMTLRRFYGELGRLAKRDDRLWESHSIEEAHARHRRKPVRRVRHAREAGAPAARP